ncbi:Quinoprotein glucose dehydrogenase B [Thalassocella blandensis]|nr:Quinoprotein glucose dehydrogenase B [Thalassocella blandensis]
MFRDIKVYSLMAGVLWFAATFTESSHAQQAQWIECAQEGGVCSFSGTKQVRYGKDGHWNEGLFTASVGCNNSVFRDPLPGQRKTCEYTDVAIPWVSCAMEGGTCSFEGVKAVRYGSGNSWVEKVSMGSIACNNTTFGDPIQGTRKECQLTEVQWTKCADENQSCDFSGDKIVRYGKNDSWFEAEFTDGVPCRNSVFGDPLQGTAKQCEIAELPFYDNQPPTKPENVTISNLQCSSADLSWSASTDNIGVNRYDIYRDGQFLGTAGGSETSIHLTNLVPGATWGFYVTAFDAAGNNSVDSDSLPIDIPFCEDDTIPPSIPLQLSGVSEGTSIRLSWQESTDNVGVSGYDVYRNSEFVATTPYNTFVDTGLSQNTEYTYQIAARDAQGNTSDPSQSILVTTGSVCSSSVCSVDLIVNEPDVPWGIVTLPDGSIIYSRRDADDVIHLKDGERINIGTISDSEGTGGNSDQTGGEGGLLGLAVQEGFPLTDNWLYMYYSTAGNRNKVARVRFENGMLNMGSKQDVIPASAGIRSSRFHNGGRLRFGPDGKLYVAVGDGQRPDTDPQDPNRLNGKILRVNPDGSIPQDNPFNNLVWSYGHRNPQGLAFDAQGQLWEQEFGDGAEDETNLIVRGGNYGYPDCEGTISRGGNGCATAGFIAPKKVYSPTGNNSCSGIAVVDNVLYVGCLAGKRMYRIVINGENLGSAEQLFTGSYGRIRTLEPSIDGGLWMSTSENDKNDTPNQGGSEIFKITLGVGNESPVVSGETYVLLNKATGRALEVPGGSVSQGESVGTYPYEGRLWHQWTINALGNGVYNIINRNSQLALNIAGDSAMQGNAIQWPYGSGSANAQWTLISAGEGVYFLVSADSGEVLDEEVSSHNVTEYPRKSSGIDNQLWSFERVLD